MLSRLVESRLPAGRFGPSVSIEKMPTDLVGKIYAEVAIDDPNAVRAVIHTWLRADLRLGHCANCPQASRGTNQPGHSP